MLSWRDSADGKAATQILVWVLAALVLGGASAVAVLYRPSPNVAGRKIPERPSVQTIAPPIQGAPSTQPRALALQALGRPDSATTPLAAVTEAVAAPAGAAESYALQLGAFLVPENAVSLIVRLGRAQPAPNQPGPYEIVETDETGRAWHKVRMGPYPSRDAAADAAVAVRRDFDIAALIVGVQPAGGAVPAQARP